MASVDFDASVDGPGVLEMGGAIPAIKVNERLRNFSKFSCLTVLHELLNNKLYWQYDRVIAYEDEIFTKAVEELWKKGVYKGLL